MQVFDNKNYNTQLTQIVLTTNQTRTCGMRTRLMIQLHIYLISTQI